MKNILFSTANVLLLLFMSLQQLAAQLKVGNNASTISSASLLELESTNKGLVFPRVSLSSAASYAPLASDVLQGTVVYNTNAAITGGQGVGLYVWGGGNWTAVSSASVTSWGLTGNTGTNPATHFIGTTDNVALRFKVNSQDAGLLQNSNYLTYFGIGAGSTANTGTGHTAVGWGALKSNTSGNHNVAIGVNTLALNTTGSRNTAIGYNVLAANTTGNYNSSLGFEALNKNDIGLFNAAFGIASLYANTSGGNNAGVGSYSLTNNTTGTANTAMGAQALYNNIGGSTNSALGAQALYLNTTGQSNVACGFFALYNNTTGRSNVALGANADVGSGNLDHAAAIGAGAYVTTSNSIVLGAIAGVNNAFASTNVGIGTTAPTERLEVVGRIKTSTLQITTAPTAGYILTSDAAGVASWVAPVAATTTAWGLTGNAGTNPATQFIGTTDNVALRFRVHNENAGLIHKDMALTYFGHGAGNNLNTASNLVAIGSQSLAKNTTGADNTAIGSFSLQANTIGESNVGVGYRSLAQNTTGVENTALGTSALVSNTEGYQNTSIGMKSLSTNTTGRCNTATGTLTMRYNTIGEFNTALGYATLFFNTQGKLNTAIGAQCMYYNTIGENNAAIGINAMYHNTSGSNNTALGYATLDENTEGGFNAAVGYNSLSENTTGTSNTAIGHGSLVTNTVGSNNTAVGRGADVGSNYLTNATAIGALAYVNRSNSIVLGAIAGVNSATTSTNVGIGYATPFGRLDIFGGDNDIALLLRSGNTNVGTTNNQIAFGYNGTSTYMHAIKTRHNAGALSGNAIDFYVWGFNVDGVGGVGTKKVMSIDGGGSSTTGIVEVNGRVRQQTFSQAVSIGGGGATNFVWNHNFGYQPVIMLSLDQTGGGYMDYCHVSYSHVNANQIIIHLSNRAGSTASGTVRWVVVN